MEIRILHKQGESIHGMRAFVDCPVAGYWREVHKIIYKDGGELGFPCDASARGNSQELEKALPQRPSVQSNEKPATQQSDDKGPPPGGKD